MMTTADEPVRGPLHGIRVLDLTRVVMGPLATQILADQGADVVTVEPAGGDTNRVMGPGPHPELSGISLNLMRNKRSVVIDLKSEGGRTAVRRLVESSDVVVSTMRPGALTRLGLDYPAVRAMREDIVYCQAQGFPLDSPHANEPAYDDIIQAATGVSDIMLRIWGSPALMPTIFADKVCGLVMAQAITAALVERQRTGQGRHIEVPMAQAMAAFMLAEHGSGAISQPPIAPPGRPATGYPRVLSPERRPHPTKDGWVHLLPYHPKHYVALFTEAGVEGAADDPRYADLRATILNSDSLYRDIRRITPSRTTDEWLDYCRNTGIPATRVASLQDLVDELEVVEHPVAGGYRVIPRMATFHGTEPALRRHAPLIGQDTADVLTELGLGPADHH
ncbi:Crotonobetainyl-CoA:carnitine CoA-transferase CaiB [Thermomonospora echinospora]|uniref:Crotonobetainyl-CoA:carnitine CoA-transferase CaiB n=2 Tax=Thermomonospora echinospora TaxID=1992 RepID=A0A1H6DZX8_9ACTN|nr:Crotonobetainyl-CoA:carnitine CoA-transferase CaiB [Thermomonospora echinospora]